MSKTREKRVSGQVLAIFYNMKGCYKVTSKMDLTKNDPSSVSPVSSSSDSTTFDASSLLIAFSSTSFSKSKVVLFLSNSAKSSLSSATLFDLSSRTAFSSCSFSLCSWVNAMVST